MEAGRARTLTLVATILASGIALLDATIVNVALPAMREDLGGGLAGQQWVMNAYLLTLGSLLLVGGSLGDLFGQRRVFWLGVAGFGVASLLCAVAPTIETLVAARALQGAASALLTPASLAVISEVYNDASERGAAIGRWTAWGGIAAVTGPLAGGLLIDSVGWRWIFGVNVPFVLVTLFLIRIAVPPLEGKPRPRLDFVGSALCALGLAGPVLALIEQPSRGWGDPLVAGGLAGGALLLAAFVWWERSISDPMLPLGLFRRRNFAWANLETLLVYAAISAFFFFLVIFLQEQAGWSALEAGLAGIPVTLILFLLSSRVGGLSQRYGPRLFMGAGPIVCGLGLLPLLLVDDDVSYVADVLPAMVLFGLGLTLTVAPLTATVMADAGRGSGGMASGVNNAVARVAGLLGIAAVGVAVAARGDGTIDVPGFHTGMAIVAAMLVAGGMLGLIGIRNRPVPEPAALPPSPETAFCSGRSLPPAEGSSAPASP
ncbi:MAG: MFS transporter [Actinomycetota bacterium]|nr:MFS transporter [Actinomycetota bacterium]